MAKEGTMYTNVAGDSKKVIDIYFNVLGEAKEDDEIAKELQNGN